MAEAEKAVASKAVGEMIAAAGIKRIICVDDVFATGIDDFVEALAGLEPAGRSAVLDEPVDQMEVDALWQDLARERWRGVEEPEQAAMVDKAFALAAGVSPVSR